MEWMQSIDYYHEDNDGRKETVLINTFSGLWFGSDSLKPISACIIILPCPAAESAATSDLTSL